MKKIVFLALITFAFNALLWSQEIDSTGAAINNQLKSTKTVINTTWGTEQTATGLGTLTPTAAFHVLGTKQSTPTDIGTQISTGEIELTRSTYPNIDFNKYPYTQDYDARMILRNEDFITLDGAALGINNTTYNSDFKLMVGGNSYFNGNVGIGTLTSSALFSINTNTVPSLSDKLLLISQPCDDSQCTFYPISVGGPSGRVDIGLYGSYTVPTDIQSARLTVNHAIGVSSNGAGSDYILISGTSCTINSNQIISFKNNASYSPIKNGGLMVYNSSSVMMSKITADGKIWAQEVVVQLTDPWPDFVFANNYSLMSISDLGNYISQNKHLPNMPSAEEVANNGVNLGQMDAKLLQKIEELTLYVVRMNEKIEALEKENKELRSNN